MPRVALLPGDGIGPVATREAVRSGRTTRDLGGPLGSAAAGDAHCRTPDDA